MRRSTDKFLARRICSVSIAKSYLHRSTKALGYLDRFIDLFYQSKVFFLSILHLNECGHMKVIARNKKASRDYEILEKIQSGIELQGTEVKSIRAGRINLLDSYAVCHHGELFIYRMHISPFEQASFYSHDPYRTRKLLLHKKEIVRLCSQVERKHLTLIPLAVYFKRQWVKIELGLCRGHKKYDKRQKIAAEENKKRLAAVMKNARR